MRGHGGVYQVVDYIPTLLRDQVHSASAFMDYNVTAPPEVFVLLARVLLNQYAHPTTNKQFTRSTLTNKHKALVILPAIIHFCPNIFWVMSCYQHIIIHLWQLGY